MKRAETDSPRQRLALAHDAPVEVVGGEEHQVAAEVPVRADHLVDMVRHVLLMAGEHDQVVGASERGGAAHPLEVVVGEEVGLQLVDPEPADEPEVVGAEVGRDAVVEVRAGEHEGAVAATRVPGIAVPVAVAVPEVVGLPRVGRQDDGDARRPESPRRDDERREADPAVRSEKLSEVEPALPVADAEPDRAGSASVSPRVGDGIGDGRAAHLPRAVGAPGLPAGAKDLHRQFCRVGRDDEPRQRSRRVASPCEVRADALHPHHRSRQGVRAP
jgi:hypothetical protein